MTTNSLEKKSKHSPCFFLGTFAEKSALEYVFRVQAYSKPRHTAVRACGAQPTFMSDQCFHGQRVPSCADAAAPEVDLSSKSVPSKPSSLPSSHFQQAGLEQSFSAVY